LTVADDILQGDSAVAALFLKARTLHEQGDLAQANGLYGAIISRAPDHADALHMRGLLALQAGHPQPAVDLMSRAIAIEPCAFMHFNRAVALARLDRLDDAIADYAAATALQPSLAPAHKGRADLLRRIGQPEKAVVALGAAIALSPQDPSLHEAVADALRSLGRPAEALAAYDRALALEPGRSATHVGRGTLLSEQMRLDDALAAFDAAVACDPDYAIAHFNRGVTLRKLRRIDEAIAANHAAIALQPDFAKAHQQLAICLLQQGRLAEGFEEYEWRRRTVEDADPRYALPSPWNGEDLTGKTLFVFHELYLGDMIQFCRYARLAELAGARVILAAPPMLHALLRTLSPTIELIGAADTPPHYDYQCALLSLPRAFRSAIAATTPYLAAEPVRRVRWREHLGSNGFRIGVCWQGSTLPYADVMQRSFPLAGLAPLADARPDARLISLQKYSGLEQLQSLPPGLRIETIASFDEGADAFVDTAAMMAACDLIITADTSVAHLAGALGAPVWVALPWLADWRWLEDRDDSPWYPSMRLFRQPRAGDWTSVFAAMADARGRER
jgi:tetratricopeptide (TPR) repeat protein